MRIHVEKTFPLQSKMGRLFSVFFLVVGLLTLLFSVYCFWSYNQVKDELVPVTAVIERIDVYRRNDDLEHEVYVSYTYDGTEYDNIHLNYYSSGMDEGDRLSLEIHPDDPAEPVNNNGLLVLIIGTVFTLTGGTLTFFAWKKPNPDKPEPVAL